MSCHDCSRKAKIKPCEKHNLKLAKICKDCCIGKMKGHKCPWFDFCWG